MKKTLIVIDMQNDFIDGSLGTAEAVKIVPNVRKKIEEYRSNGDEIIFTRDTHGEDYLSTPEGKKLPVVHCVKNTHGWQIADGLDVPDAIHIDKPSFAILIGINSALKKLSLQDFAPISALCQMR